MPIVSFARCWGITYVLVGKPGVPSLALFGYKVSLAEGGGSTVRPEEVRVGIEVKVADSHPISYRRGMVGTIVGRWGGEEFVAVDVHCADDRHRLFWPYDLEEITPPPARPSWRHSKRGGGSA